MPSPGDHAVERFRTGRAQAGGPADPRYFPRRWREHHMSVPLLLEPRTYAATDALAARLSETIARLLRRSLHVRHLDAGSCNGCDWEIQTLLGPVYDIQRL